MKPAAQTRVPAKKNPRKVSTAGPTREVINDVSDQFQRWVQLGNELTVVIRQGFHTTVGRFNPLQVDSGAIILQQDKGKMHLLSVKDCRRIKLSRKQGSCTICFSGDDWEPVVLITDRTPSSENRLEAFAVSSDVVH